MEEHFCPISTLSEEDNNARQICDVVIQNIGFTTIL